MAGLQGSFVEGNVQGQEDQSEIKRDYFIESLIVFAAMLQDTSCGSWSVLHEAQSRAHYNAGGQGGVLFRIAISLK